MIPAWIAQRDLDQDGAVSYDDFLHSVASSFAVPAKAKAKKGDTDDNDEELYEDDEDDEEYEDER